MNTTSGQTVARELLILCLNTSSTSTPTWSPVGKRVTESDVEYNWNDSTEQDILGDTYTQMRKPIMKESFDTYYPDSGDAAGVAIINDAVVNHDAQALCNKDVLLVHAYLGTAAAPWVERYPSSAIKPTKLGGEGGGNLVMAFDVTFGGTRTTGTAARNATTGVITFPTSG
jgi:hypothetical protein